ncbi:MAG: polyprenyl synthetase family protein [Acidobacteria bacterium]|nr:polyprenyl synthetase family protein [Acidobacteriota bacterium]
MRELLEEPGTIALMARAEAVARMIDKEIIKDIAEVTQPLLLEATTYLFKSGGKRLRPFLVITCAEALGGVLDDAIPPALAVEYLHNLSLIHDDMMDHSEKRHGLPTLHSQFGNRTSLLVGDLLYAKAVEQASRVARHAIRMVDVLAKAAKLMCLGQFDDMSFETRMELEIEDYLIMASRKTSALYRASCICGVLAGDGTEDQVNAMAVFGEKIGTAFQIWDDVLDLQADPLRLGKPLGLDIRDGKKTLIVIHFLKYAKSPEREQFLKYLGNPGLTRELPEAVALLEEAGSIAFARDIAWNLLEDAKKQLHVLPESPARDLLYQYADFLLQRNY